MALTLKDSNWFHVWIFDPFETVIVGLTLNDLAERMHVENALQLHNLFLGRAIGAVFGTWADWASCAAWRDGGREIIYKKILRY